MGIFDLPAPLFYFFDNKISFLPDLLRLFTWGTLAGALGMIFYALISPQGTIATTKLELREAQGRLAQSDDSFDDLWQLIKKTLALSFKHLGLIFIPAFVSSLPVICILAWTSNEFSHDFPEAGEYVGLSVQPQSGVSELVWQSAELNPTYVDSSWQFVWPDDGQSVSVSDELGNVLATFPLPAAIPQIHKKLWWNQLLGNPAGYLPSQSPINLIVIDFPEAKYIPFGPAWLRNWLTFFFLEVICSGLVIKWLFRIH